MNSDEISATLWELDPMQTGCSGCDEMRNEYASQAVELATLIETGTPLRAAVIEVFDKWFWEDCLISSSATNRLDAVVERISKLNR